MCFKKKNHNELNINIQAVLSFYLTTFNFFDFFVILWFSYQMTNKQKTNVLYKSSISKTSDVF